MCVVPMCVVCVCNLSELLGGALCPVLCFQLPFYLTPLLSHRLCQMQAMLALSLSAPPLAWQLILLPVPLGIAKL